MSEFSSAAATPIDADKESETLTQSLSQVDLEKDKNKNNNKSINKSINNEDMKNYNSNDIVEVTNSEDEVIDTDRDEINLVKALAAKEEGNQYFRNKEYDEAIVKYSEAIEFCPKDNNQNRKSYVTPTRTNSNSYSKSNKEEVFIKEDNGEDSNERKPEQHKYAEQLATFYGNRSAAYFSIEEYEMVVDDCTDALDLKPDYVKVLIRRYQAYEKLDKIEDALADAKRVQEIEPSYPKIRETVNRLQRLYDERMNKLKDEALGKLKDLGNSILGTFGMSLDNFKMQQDPTSGSWNISMNK